MCVSVNSLVVWGFCTSIVPQRKGVKLVAENETASKPLIVEPRSKKTIIKILLIS